MSHTPGPWTARTSTPEAPPHVVAIFQDEQNRRCTAFVAHCESATLDNKANAQLIAAAPDLIAALKRLAAYGNIFVTRSGDTSPYDQAVAAIAKAEGR